MARGLITDLEGNIKALPFKKFFNMSEHTGEDSTLPSLPLEEFEVFDKMDGSLGILYWIGEEPRIATRGSFTSDQAIKGTGMLRKYPNAVWDRQYTYLFEIIYPENRIVVDYGGNEKLVLLAVIDTETGKEKSRSDIESRYTGRVPLVDRFDFDHIEEILGMMRENAEGFVIRFKSGVRTKLKYEEYVRLHRLITGVNAKTIWELLRNNQPFDELMERVPDEFYVWVKSTKAHLQGQFDGTETYSKQVLEQAKKYYKNRKDQAKFIMESTKAPSVVFSMLDGKDYSKVIWQMLKPRADKPWKEDIDS